MKSPWFESKYAQFPNNLPLQLNSFIGRESELEQLRQLFWSTRLLTLTGPGGCGKTRLALKLAEQLLDAFSDGVWFVDLAPLPETGPIPQTVAAVFSIHEPTGRSFSAALIDYLRPREMLILLDNCEHVLPACAELAMSLLHACPNLFLLATSREAFNIDGEISWQTPPLTTIDPETGVGVETLSTSEAPRLFLDRAMTVQPAFVATGQNAPSIAQICHQLDGLPLAIELAAARVSTLSVEQIAERLVDRFDLLNLGRRTAPARHQTIRAMIDWSYGLLSPEEKTLFRRLAIFAGGWTIEAAEAVCSDDKTNIQAYDEGVPTVDALSRLAAKSLIIADTTRGDVRYRFLETIRQYAREKLAGERLEGGKVAQSRDYEQMRDRHLAYFIEWAENAESGLSGQDQQIWLGRYEREHENIRAALEWGLLGKSRAEQCLQLAVASSRFFMMHGYLSEGRSYLSAALNREQPAKGSPLRAIGLTWLATLAFLQSDFPNVHRLVEESLSIWRALSLERSADNAWTLKLQGDLMMEEGDYAKANALLKESLGIFRELNNVIGICDVLMLLGWASMRAGDYPEAMARLEEFLGLARKTGFAYHIAFALSGLGELAVRQGQYERARGLLEESLALRRAHGDRWGVGTALGSLGWAALRQGDYQQMRTALKESAAIRMETGDKGGIAWCLEKLAEGTFLEARAQPARTRSEWYQRAVRIYGAAAAIRAPLGSVIDQADQPEYERNIARLRNQLGRVVFAESWSEGEKLIAQDQGFAEVLELGLQETGADPANTAIPLEQKSIGIPGGLSRREREVARLIVQGKSNREIANALTVELKTVEAHINHIFNKLGFDSRVQIAVWAMEKGLARPSEN